MPISGLTEHQALISCWAVTAVSLVAALLDMKSGKIPNRLTLSVLAIALIFSALTGGVSGILASFLAALVALVALGWMFLIGVMGGGDVKLLMALAAWMDFRFAIESAVLSVIVGGVMALGILAYRRRLVSFVNKAKILFLSLAVKELRIDPPALDRSLTMPFGIAIAAGATWTAWAHPLRAWGVLPW